MNNLNHCYKEYKEKNFFQLLIYQRQESGLQGELEILIDKQKFDIIGIVETWWDNLHDWNVKITDYNLFRKDKVGKGEMGGGTLH